MRFDKIINKIVIQDGGPDAILNISVIQKNYIYENITLHERPYKKQMSKFSSFYIEIWRNYQQNSNPRWWSDAILNISII